MYCGKEGVEAGEEKGSVAADLHGHSRPIDWTRAE